MTMIILVLIVKVALIILEGLDKTFAAVIGFTGVILTAIINNYFTKVNQIESNNRIEKQKNYDELISSIGKYLRDPNKSNDDFQTIHHKSWIYGSEDVVKQTAELIKINRDDELEKFDKELEKLIRLMRKDTGLSNIDAEFIIPYPERKIRGT